MHITVLDYEVPLLQFRSVLVSFVAWNGVVVTAPCDGATYNWAAAV